jgi:hypothetical protein
MTLRPIRTDDAPGMFDRWRADPSFAVDDHPVHGAFGRWYFPAVFGDQRRDRSFVVAAGDDPLLFANCTLGRGVLDYYGTPARLFCRADLDEQEAARAVEAAFAEFDRLQAGTGIDAVTIADPAGVGTLSTIGRQCLNRRAGAELKLTASCDIAEGEVGMHRALRKSYKSLLNWGKRNLDIQYVGSERPDRALFDRYHTFHRDVAGRVTRPDASWDAMYEWIIGGRGELVLGFRLDKLVTATVVVDGARASYYASGVYDRESFDKPMAHWPLWLAMLRCAGRGMREFDLGDVPLHGAAEPKEVAIGYFKRGFATTIATSVAWHWRQEAREP